MHGPSFEEVEGFFWEEFHRGCVGRRRRRRGVGGDGGRGFAFGGEGRTNGMTEREEQVPPYDLDLRERAGT